MVRIRDVAWAVAAVAAVLAGPRPASADPINLTGNVTNDFTSANGSVDVPLSFVPTSGPLKGQVQYTNGPGYVAGPDGSNPNVLVGGVDMKGVWLNYNASTDTMYVGIQGFKNVAGKPEIFGDITGNPDPTQDVSSGASNTFGGLKSVALAFAPMTHDATGQPVPGTPAIIAGIPQDKSLGGSGTTDGFTVSNYSANGAGLPFSFGSQIPGAGNLAFNTSAAHPDFEFTINNFSKLAGIDPKNGFFIEGYAGMPGSVGGKSQFSWIQAPAPQGFEGPEPATWLAWALLAGGAGWRQYRRRLTATARP
jgi:hypothetical protein